MYLIIANSLDANGMTKRDEQVGRGSGSQQADAKIRFGRMRLLRKAALTFEADCQWLNRRERLAQSAMACVSVYER